MQYCQDLDLSLCQSRVSSQDMVAQYDVEVYQVIELVLFPMDRSTFDSI